MQTRSAFDAQSKIYQQRGGEPDWSRWKIENAVKEGYTQSGWVYRAVNIISNAASSVPFHVVNADGEVLEQHPVTLLLRNPNPEIPRQELFSLFVQWLEIAGNAYAKKVIVGGKTTELWAMSPDKIAPVVGGAWVEKYAVKNNSGSVGSYVDKKEMLHFKLSNPANPTVGVSPMQAASKPIDTDVEQQGFNKVAMQNRGIMDGVFVFKNLAASQWETVRQKIREMFSGKNNARTPGVISSEADYIRTGMTPAEMDFIKSREFNRDEILLIFGVPLEMVGSKSTYNNFETARRVFWDETVIPILVKLRETLSHSLSDELAAGERIVFDLTNVPAMQQSMAEKLKLAKSLWSNGVPFAVINARLELGLDAFDGADMPWGGIKPTQAQTQLKSASPKTETRKRKKSVLEIRDAHEAAAARKLEDLFDAQRKAVVDAIKNGGDYEKAITDTRKEWTDTIAEIQRGVALDVIKQ